MFNDGAKHPISLVAIILIGLNWDTQTQIQPWALAWVSSLVRIPLSSAKENNEHLPEWAGTNQLTPSAASMLGGDIFVIQGNSVLTNNLQGLCHDPPDMSSTPSVNKN